MEGEVGYPRSQLSAASNFNNSLNRTGLVLCVTCVYVSFGAVFTSLSERLRTHEIFTKDKIVVVIYFLITTSSPYIICCGYLLESPPRGDSNRSPQDMI